jgi:hypothetical protein
MEKEPIKSHEDLEVYKMAFDVAMKIFEQEAREQGAISWGEGTERGIRPHPHLNHLTLIGGLRPMFRSAPPLLVGVISPQLIAPNQEPLR